MDYEQHIGSRLQQTSITTSVSLGHIRHIYTISQKFLEMPDKGGGGDGEDVGAGTESKWGMDWDGVGNTENWSNWSNGVNEAILVQILGESFEVDWAESAGSCNKSSGQGGDWSGNLGCGHGGGDNCGEDDLKKINNVVYGLFINDVTRRMK